MLLRWRHKHSPLKQEIKNLIDDLKLCLSELVVPSSYKYAPISGPSGFPHDENTYISPNLKAFISGEETSDRKAVSPKFRKGLPPTQMLQV